MVSNVDQLSVSPPYRSTLPRRVESVQQVKGPIRITWIVRNFYSLLAQFATQSRPDVRVVVGGKPESMESLPESPQLS